MTAFCPDYTERKRSGELMPSIYGLKPKFQGLLRPIELAARNGVTADQREMFWAIKGNGGMARFVEMPAEDHVYRARESIGHILWEMVPGSTSM